MASRRRGAATGGPGARGVRAPILRALRNLSSDWYWEQDAKLRFTRVEALNPQAGELPIARKILGKRRWETGVEIEGGWGAHRAALAARETFRDVLMWCSSADGTRRYVSVSGEPVFDRSGRFAGYRGIGRDVTVQKSVERALREGEARFRSLAELSSDWYWEQDAQYRFTRIEGRAPSGADGGLRDRLIGKCRWESGLEVEGGWEAHRALLAARKPFSNLLMWRTMPDGRKRYIVVSGEPVPGEDGGLAGYRGVGSDVTAQKRNEQLLQLEHQVARLLSEADSAAAGVRGVLRAVCESEGWGCGRYFKLDDAAQVLRFEDGWCLPEPEYERFLAASRALVFNRGQGLAGLAWESGEPIWSADTSRDPRVLASSMARDSRIRGAFVCGVVTGGRTVGVLTFSSDAVREPEARLLRAARVIGSQVGQFLRRKQAEAILRASEERFRRTFELAGAGVMHVSLEGRILRVNRRCCEILDRPEGELTGRSVKQLSHPEDRDVTDTRRARMHSGELDTVHFEKRYLRRDGSAVWVSLSVAIERDAAGEPLYEIAVIDDITEKKKMETALRESEERFRSLTQMSSDFFWESDERHRLRELVHGPGYRPPAGPDATGKAPWEIASVSPDAAGWAAHRETLERRLPFRDFEFARAAADATVRHYSVSGAPRFDAGGRFLGYRGVGREVTEIVQARERIASLAYSDPLTGLANRVSLAPALDQAVQRARRKHAKVALAFVDLDGFKQVNDTLGHDAGDALLVEVANRLRANLRASDLIGRLGGDEFLVVLEDVHDPAPVETVARKLLAGIGQPYSVGGGVACVTASIGLSIYPDDASDAPSLMKHADIAMYVAKQGGKNAFSLYASGPAANDPARALEQPARGAG